MCKDSWCSVHWWNDHTYVSKGAPRNGDRKYHPCMVHVIMFWPIGHACMCANIASTFQKSMRWCWSQTTASRRKWRPFMCMWLCFDQCANIASTFQKSMRWCWSQTTASRRKWHRRCCCPAVYDSIDHFRDGKSFLELKYEENENYSPLHAAGRAFPLLCLYYETVTTHSTPFYVVICLE